MKKEKIDVTYVPVQMFIRISRKENETRERALLVARREDGSEFIFRYLDDDMYDDITVCEPDF